MSKADQTASTIRLFTRVPFDAEGVLDIEPNRHECRLVDISLKGALVERDQPWQAAIGMLCSLSVRLANEGADILMKGEVAHVENGRLGVRCTEIDLDSMTNLRRLVELNLGDETILQRELQAMVKARRKA